MGCLFTQSRNGNLYDKEDSPYDRDLDKEMYSGLVLKLGQI